MSIYVEAARHAFKITPTHRGRNCAVLQTRSRSWIVDRPLRWAPDERVVANVKSGEAIGSGHFARDWQPHGGRLASRGPRPDHHAGAERDRVRLVLHLHSRRQ